MRLPVFADYEGFHAWRTDTSKSLPAAIDIASSHGISCTNPHAFATGTNLVVALDDRLIIKVFPPLLRRQFASERAALAALRGRLKLAIPEIVVEGERDGWPYLVITRLSGALGKEAWPRLPEVQKVLWFDRFPVTRFHQEGQEAVVEILDLRFAKVRPDRPASFTYRVRFDKAGKIVDQGWVRE